jgi:hypothetical protein
MYSARLPWIKSFARLPQPRAGIPPANEGIGVNAFAERFPNLSIPQFAPAAVQVRPRRAAHDRQSVCLTFCLLKGLSLQISVAFKMQNAQGTETLLPNHDNL